MFNNRHTQVDRGKIMRPESYMNNWFYFLKKIHLNNNHEYLEKLKSLKCDEAMLEISVQMKVGQSRLKEHEE